jgi:hypothetical protein
VMSFPSSGTATSSHVQVWKYITGASALFSFMSGG